LWQSISNDSKPGFGSTTDVIGRHRLNCIGNCMVSNWKFFFNNPISQA
jgi:hypothetical protein